MVYFQQTFWYRSFCKKCFQKGPKCKNFTPFSIVVFVDIYNPSSHKSRNITKAREPARQRACPICMGHPPPLQRRPPPILAAMVTNPMAPRLAPTGRPKHASLDHVSSASRKHRENEQCDLIRVPLFVMFYLLQDA